MEMDVNRARYHKLLGSIDHRICRHARRCTVQQRLNPSIFQSEINAYNPVLRDHPAILD